ncbi:MAG TPA: hypothetical protein VMK65_04510 [Longimicrobiales bacterium]|nr:hypothetical protein [Longimicrobiales bacterium]
MMLRVLCAAGLALAAMAQSAVPAAGQTADGRVRVFLDCDPCDFDYLRREMGFVDYVREPAVADVHVLVTRQGTGGGGQEYTLSFLGRGRFTGVGDTLQVLIDRADTEAERRAALARGVGLGLVRYVARTPDAQGLRIGFEGPDAGEGPPLPADDPWRGWVFSLSMSGSADGEETRHSESLNGNVTARRITSDWKVWLNGGGNLRHRSFDVGDTTYTNTTRNYRMNGLVVNSLGPHWSVGTRANMNISNFRNQDLTVGMGPAIEFSFWPYGESSRRSLRAQYRLTAQRYDYTEETIYDKLEETLAEQGLELSFNATQPWGEARLSVELENYLHDFSKHRASLGGFASVRVFRGLSINVNGNVARVQNQLYLPKGDLTPEEVLLQRRQLQTGYEYRTSVGFSYTFGSIYNNVVNARF